MASTINPFELLKAHLNVAWLRPESALWDAVASVQISKYKILPPSLDLGCGNGIFSFITAGGNFSIDYDWYINSEPDGFWGDKDVYDVCKIDTLDEFIIKDPAYTFTYGLDYKAKLLKQARALHFYENLIEFDANRILPFSDGQLNTIFSNILYWLPDLKNSLSEVGRVLNKNGVAILCVPNIKFYDYCFSYHWKDKNSELLRLLNRGRSKNMLWVISYAEFLKLTTRLGFKIIDHVYYLSSTVLKIWDIGLRSISPILIKMVNKLTVEDRRAIKLEWTDTLIKLLSPLYEIEINNRNNGGFHLFVLEKTTKK